MSVKKFVSRALTIFLLMALIAAGLPGSARAAGATITVGSTADNFVPDDLCTLSEAIVNADTNSGVYADCAPGSGNDTIVFAASLGTATLVLGSMLPYVNDSAGLTIDGGNHITLNGNDSVRVFWVQPTGSLVLQNISVTHGSGDSGGGLYNSLGQVTITHSTFSSNHATIGSGGALLNADGTVTITGSTFRDNSAVSDGGGVTNSVGTLTVVNSTFYNNSAAGGGGGIENNSGTATIINSTFSGNQSDAGGAALSVWKGSTAIPTTTLRNSILANSITSDDCWNHTTAAAVLAGGNNLIEATSSCSSLATLTGDPKLGSLAGAPAYLPLLAGSPAINTGSDAICASAPVNNTSQNGVRRPQGTHCDLGAYESGVFLTLRSVGAQDGWVLESSESGATGGTLNATATSFRLGDDAARRQYRVILSFNSGAGLPDNAVITAVSLKIRQQGIAGGGDPLTILQGFMVDIKKGILGSAAGLESTDFQSASHRSFGPFLPGAISNWYTIDLTGGRAYINKLATNGGLTQIRLRLKLDDNNDAVANYLNLYSGDAPAAARPQLIITYYIP